MINEKDRVRKASAQYKAMQARQKRVQDLRERLEKPGMILKMSIILGFSLVCSLGFLDPIFRLFGFDPR